MGSKIDQIQIIAFIIWKESFYVTCVKYSLEMFQYLSEILFTYTGNEVYLASCFMACCVTSSLVELSFL